MSIYATTLSFDNDEHDPSCARMRELGPDNTLEPVAPGEIPIGVLTEEGAFQLVDGECTCDGFMRQPIVYRGSHVYPDMGDRGGGLDLGVIPGHIAEGGGYDEDHEHGSFACHRPFLRIGLMDPFGGDYPERNAPPSNGTVVLDAEQVAELRDDLTDFLERLTGSYCEARKGGV